MGGACEGSMGGACDGSIGGVGEGSMGGTGEGSMVVRVNLCYGSLLPVTGCIRRPLMCSLTV